MSNILTKNKMNGIKKIDSNCENVLPHTKMAGRDKNDRTNSRTFCQQNRIAFSPPKGRKIKRQFIRLSCSDRNDHVIHDDDDGHNDDDHCNNDQYDLVRGAGPSVPTEENALSNASKWLRADLSPHHEAPSNLKRAMTYDSLLLKL
jgi:hypothetical protein